MIAVRREFRRHGQRMSSNASEGKDGVGDGWRDAKNGGFAGTDGGLVLAVDEKGVHGRNVAEAGDAIFGEAIVEDATVLELNGFEERSADTHDVGSDELIAKAVRIDDSAAVEGRKDALKFELACGGVQRNFHEGGHVAEFFVAATDTKGVIGGAGIVPSKSLGTLFEDSAKAIVVQVCQAES